LTSENRATEHRARLPHLAIVGVGLIGGSLARAVRERALVSRITGIGRGEKSIQKALELGVIDEMTTDVSQGVASADLIVLAAPVESIVSLLREITHSIKPGAIVTDVGSVKGPIVREADRLFQVPSPFVGGHPIAGTENSGVEASFSTLFQKRKCILTPTTETDMQALEKVKLLWTEVGSEVICMDVDEHDKIMGIISHLPHIVAYALVNTVDRIDPKGDTIYRFSAGGFKDFTRIASSHPEMWRDICLMNRDAILEAVEAFTATLYELKEMVKNTDGEGLERAFENSRRVRAWSIQQGR
jgi:prephenate dehydrogenase